MNIPTNQSHSPITARTLTIHSLLPSISTSTVLAYCCVSGFSFTHRSRLRSGTRSPILIDVLFTKLCVYVFSTVNYETDNEILIEMNPNRSFYNRRKSKQCQSAKMGLVKINPYPRLNDLRTYPRIADSNIHQN